MQNIVFWILIPKQCTKTVHSCSAKQIYFVGPQGVARRCSAKKRVLKNFAKFTGENLCWSLFVKKVAGLTPATLLKRRLQHRCYPVSFAKFLRTPFL